MATKAADVDRLIARSIDALIGYHGLNRKTLAVILGRSDDTLGRRMENGGWSVAELQTIATFFDLPMDQIAEGRPDLARSQVRSSDGVHPDGGKSSYFNSTPVAA